MEMATDTSNTVVTGVETTDAINLTSLLLPDSAQLQPQVHILTVAYHTLIFGTSFSRSTTKESEPRPFHNDVRNTPLPSSCQDESALDASANVFTEPSRDLQRRKRRRVWMAAVLAVTMASVAGLVCWSNNCAAKTASTTPEPSRSVVKPSTTAAQPSLEATVDATVTATPTPSPNPTTVPVNRAPSEEQSIRARQIVNFINSITLSGRSIALQPLDTGTTNDDRMVNNDSATVEEAAVQWLIYNDALQLPAPPFNNATLQFYMQQRYALTALLLSTGTALDTMSELYHGHECEWMGVECQSVLIGDSNSNSDTGLTTVQAVTAIEWHSRNATSNGSGGGGRPVVPDVGLLSSHLIKVELSMNGFMSAGNVSLPLLPPEIGRWTNLEHFSLTVMPQSGGDDDATATATAPPPDRSVLSSSPLPETIGLWAYLSYFFLSSGRAVTGSLPASIGQWAQLKYFNVTNNAGLTGSLPTSIGQWTNLEVFSVASNALTGSLPDSIESWTSLVRASIDDNDIVGAIPIGICDSATRNEAEIYVNCDRVDCPCGATVCKCGLPF